MSEHPIRLRDTATGEKIDFTPRDWREGAADPHVRMYVCGPTVYDRAHIGNARPAVVFDVLFRLLRHVYGDDRVTYVRNLTDVEDKINDRAAERYPDMPPLEGIARLTRETTEWYHEDMDALGVLRPTHEPRATEYVPQMIEMIGKLVASGHAYEAEGHVLFDVGSYPDYGGLSHRDTEDMLAGARVEVAPYKRDPMDFVLWKPSTEDQPGWDSPWGRGRPGWHIECSAMSKALLGEDFDIHGGGADLLFPHHENERAQSCCAAPGHGFADVWLHNGMITVNGQKMSKSLGNFITVEEALEGLRGEVIRLAFLMTHYRATLDWNVKRRTEAQKKLKRWRESLSYRGANWVYQKSPGKVCRKVLGALYDDLNTPAAITEMDALAKAARTRRDSLDEKARDASEKLVWSMRIMGIDPFEGQILEKMAEKKGGRHSEYMKIIDQNSGSWVSNRIEFLLEERRQARKAKDFERADAIRNALAASGVIVTDTPQGAEWELSPEFDPARLEDVQ